MTYICFVIEALKKLSKNELILEVVNQKSAIEKLTVEYKSEVAYLKHQVSLFQKALFGSKKEEHIAIENTEQIKLAFDEKIDLDLPQDTEKQEITYHRKKSKKRTDYSKLELPAELERVVIVLEPADKTDDMVRIGEEVTELLAITPQKFFLKKKQCE